MIKVIYENAKSLTSTLRNTQRHLLSFNEVMHQTYLFRFLTVRDIVKSLYLQYSVPRLYLNKIVCVQGPEEVPAQVGEDHCFTESS